jgi:serine/threonine protein phosphatase 1
MLTLTDTETSTSQLEAFACDDVHPSHPLFVIGDIHGLSIALTVALDEARAFLCDHEDGKVIFLGDLIDRGPNSVGVLRLVAKFRNDFPGRVELLAGNHETMMLGSLYLRDHSEASSIRYVWSRVGGEWGSHLPSLKKFLQKIGLGLRTWRKFYRSGNVLCVHAGIEPHSSANGLDQFLSQTLLYLPGTRGSSFPHWAWIRDNFLQCEQPLPGGFVVHGHTPSDFRDSPRAGRLNLDAGSYLTGSIAAAVLTDGAIALRTFQQPLQLPQHS